LLIEPHIAAHRQAMLWSALFAVFVLLCAAAAWCARAGALPVSVAQSGENETAPAPTLRERLLWLGLAACSSMLLLSITNKLLEDVAPVPLLWVLPLALYLVTFALTFSRRIYYWRGVSVRFLALALGSLGYAIYEPMYTESVQVSVPVFCIALFCAAGFAMESWRCEGRQLPT